jgi:hypothetical protein
MDTLKSIKDWPFMQEPLYRWAIFFVAISIIAMVWRCVLSYMER